MMSRPRVSDSEARRACRGPQPLAVRQAGARASDRTTWVQRGRGSPQGPAPGRQVSGRAPPALPPAESLTVWESRSLRTCGRKPRAHAVTHQALRFVVESRGLCSQDSSLHVCVHLQSHVELKHRKATDVDICTNSTLAGAPFLPMPLAAFDGVLALRLSP